MNIELNDRVALEIVVNEELWGLALFVAGTHWLIYRIEWEGGDLEYINSKPTKDEIKEIVREWIEENDSVEAIYMKKNDYTVYFTEGVAVRVMAYNEKEATILAQAWRIGRAMSYDVTRVEEVKEPREGLF